MNAQEQAISIIDRLGGTTAAAELCEVTPSAVSQWKGAKGIPKQQLRFLKVARPDLFEDRSKCATKGPRRTKKQEQIS